MVLVYNGVGARRFRLEKGLRDRILVTAGALAHPLPVLGSNLNIRPIFSFHPQGDGYRAKLDFVADATYDDLPPEDRARALVEYGEIRFEVFDHVARQEVLRGLGKVHRGRSDLAERVRYAFPERAVDCSMSLYMDLHAKELPHEPVIHVLRSVLRHAPDTFPYAGVTLYYQLRTTGS